MRRKKKARPKRSATRQAPRYVWVSTEKGVVWRDDQGTDRNLLSADEVREQLHKKELAKAERALLEQEQQRQAAAAKEPIRFKCPLCKTQISVPVEKAGEKGSCPQCKASMLVPEKSLTPKTASYIQCLECGALEGIDEGDCSQCGKPLPEEKDCSKCGDVIVRPGVKFCPDCGFELAARV